MAVAEIEDVLRNSGAQRQVLIIDACRNVPPAPGARKSGLPLTPRFSAIQAGRGIGPIYSSAPGGFSYEGLHEYSTFTEYVLKGLHGEADGADGFVTVDDLRRYVEREVPLAEGKRDNIQQPYHSGQSTGEIVLARVKSQPAVVLGGSSARDAAEEARGPIKYSTNPQDFDEFAAMFPESALARTAKLRASTLRRLQPWID